MTNCKECDDMTCLKTGRPCEKVEKLLPKKTTGRNKKEILFDPNVLEIVALERAMQLKHGKRKKQHLYD